MGFRIRLAQCDTRRTKPHDLGIVIGEQAGQSVPIGRARGNAVALAPGIQRLQQLEMPGLRRLHGIECLPGREPGTIEQSRRPRGRLVGVDLLRMLFRHGARIALRTLVRRRVAPAIARPARTAAMVPGAFRGDLCRGSGAEPASTRSRRISSKPPLDRGVGIASARQADGHATGALSMAVRTGTKTPAYGPEPDPVRHAQVGQPGPAGVVERRDHDGGIVVFWCADRSIDALAMALGEAARRCTRATALLHYSARVDAERLARALDTHAGSLDHFGCSTGGELTPGGVQTESMVAILLPGDLCEVDLDVIENIDALGIQAIATEAARRRHRFLDARNAVSIGGRDVRHCFGLCLIDGLTFQEEAVTAALDRGLDDIPLVGGSAGDDLALTGTTQLCNGRVYRRAAVLALIACRLPFRLFSTNHLRPTAKRFVVTASDIERRRVLEFDAEPAADAYARAIGVAPEALDARVFSAHPVAVRVGGDCYCRAIRAVNPDRSLSFFCAIDDGIVLTLARTEDVVRVTDRVLDELDRELAGLTFVLAFDCVHRRIEAEYRNQSEALGELYAARRVVGFSTYGEQFGAMHLNHTFTGIAFGGADAHRDRLEHDA